MTVTEVFGVHWGDEGKGKVIDAILEREKKYNIVARWNGGDNAGHTVEPNGTRFGLHLIPTGIFHKHVVNVMGNGEVINLESLKTEIESLRNKGVEVTPNNLILSERSHLILPYYKEIERRKEASRKIGTTGRGIGVTYTHKPDRTGVRVVDLLDSGESFKEKVRMHAEEYGLQLNPQEILDRQRKLLQDLLPFLRVEDTVYFFHRNSDANILLEGAQGALLDVDAGTYPYVTSSNSSPGGAYIGCQGIPRIDRFIGVMKGPYTTRVGGGPFPTGLITEEENARLEEELKRAKDRGKMPLEEITQDDMNGVEIGERLSIAKYFRVNGFEYGTTTGRARRPGWQDLVAARYAFTLAGRPQPLGGVELVLTKNDVADSLPEIMVCTGYRIDSNVTQKFPNSIEVLRRAEPVYEVLDGWMKNTRGMTRSDQLPSRYNNFVRFFEDQLKVPVTMISTGPSRREVIYTNDRSSW